MPGVGVGGWGGGYAGHSASSKWNSYLSISLHQPEFLQKMQRALSLTSLNMSITSLWGCIRSEQGADLIRVHWANIVTWATLLSVSLLIHFPLDLYGWWRVAICDASNFFGKCVILRLNFLFSMLTRDDLYSQDVMQDAPKREKGFER